MPKVEDVKVFLLDFQDQLTALVQRLESSGEVCEDAWTRDLGGGGRSRVLRDGTVFEQAGINFSHIEGDALPAAASARRPELTGRAYEALGVSVVVHPRNPHVPTSHCNVRFFVANASGQTPIWWFGGGFDLTPYYPRLEDVVHWHRTAAAACAPFGADFYARFKHACDQYFYLPHRGEARGIGGLFFDDFSEGGFARAFAFTKRVADHYWKGFGPILERRIGQPYTDIQRDFQLYRRGRYVEFNLIHDRGTLFGLQSGGRTESILMSLPPLVKWHYGYQPEPGSDEAALAPFLQPRDWLSEGNGLA